MSDLVVPWHSQLLLNDQRSLAEIRHILERAVLEMHARMYRINKYALVAELLVVVHQHVRAYFEAQHIMRAFSSSLE